MENKQRKELLEQLIYHSKMIEKIDNKLKQACKVRVDELCKAGDTDGAKKYITDFFRGDNDYSLEKDFMYAYVNQVISGKITIS